MKNFTKIFSLLLMLISFNAYSQTYPYKENRNTWFKSNYFKTGDTNKVQMYIDVANGYLFIGDSSTTGLHIYTYSFPGMVNEAHGIGILATDSIVALGDFPAIGAATGVFGQYKVGQERVTIFQADTPFTPPLERGFAGQFLTTDGFDNLTWATVPAGGDVSFTDTLRPSGTIATPFLVDSLIDAQPAWSTLGNTGITSGMLLGTHPAGGDTIRFLVEGLPHIQMWSLGGNSSFGKMALAFNTLGTDNTAVGLATLFSNTTGFLNTAVGVNSMYWNLDGANNSALGYQSLFSNTSGTNNTGVGFQAGRNTTTGTNNTAVGKNALLANLTSHGNTAIGSGSLENNFGSENTATGLGSLALNNIGSYNVANGYQAHYANRIGTNNAYFGYLAGFSQDSSHYNVGIGNNALQGDITLTNKGSYNTAVGNEALRVNKSGDYNTAVGYLTLPANTTGNGNSAFGAGCLEFNTTGSENIANGQNALGSNTTGSNNASFGNFAGYYGNHNNRLFIDNQDRTDSLGQERKSLITGTFGSDSSLQDIRINGQLKVSNMVDGTAADSVVVWDYADFKYKKVAGSDLTNGSAWSLTGNAGTDTSINFIGATDNLVLIFKAQNRVGLLSGDEIYFGDGAGTSGTAVGIQNVGIGYYSLFANTDGSNNVAVGPGTLQNNITGNGNTAIGANAVGATNSTEVATIIGYSAVADSNGIAIGNLATSGKNHFAIPTSIDSIDFYGFLRVPKILTDTIGIGTSTPLEALEVNGNISVTNGNSIFLNAGGQLYLNWDIDGSVDIGSNSSGVNPKSFQVRTGSTYFGITQDSIGRVGINNSLPQVDLDVVGDLQTTSDKTQYYAAVPYLKYSASWSSVDIDSISTVTNSVSAVTAIDYIDSTSVSAIMLNFSVEDNTVDSIQIIIAERVESSATTGYTPITDTVVTGVDNTPTHVEWNMDDIPLIVDENKSYILLFLSITDGVKFVSIYSYGIKTNKRRY